MACGEETVSGQETVSGEARKEQIDLDTNEVTTTGRRGNNRNWNSHPSGC